MIDFIPHIAVIVAGATGVILASYIRYKKTHRQVMVCPMHSNCETVTHSEFSRFLGIPVELLGIAYYTVICIGYLAFLLIPSLYTIYTAFVIIVISTVAVLFSAYLTFIQIVTLKQLCTWCLASAALCTVIFLVAIFGTEHYIIEILQQSHRAVLGMHILGLALGLGAATTADILFFRSLKDFRISHWEAEILHTLSQIIWVGLAILILSGTGLYLSNMEVLNQSSKFMAKVGVVAVILVNGAFLNLLVSPKLIHISFGAIRGPATDTMSHWRKIALALGAVSATSWYTAFTLGMLRSIPLSTLQILFIYLVLLCCAIGGSQVVGYYLRRRSHAQTTTQSTMTTN